MEKNLFNVNNIEIENGKLNFHFINIENYSDDLKVFLDNSIASIWNGILGDNDIEIVKIELQN